MTTVPAALKPKRAGTFGGGTMLNTGMGPSVVPALVMLARTIATPICDVDGHRASAWTPTAFASWPSVHWSIPAGSPTNPGGRSTVTSRTGSRGHGSPLKRPGADAVLKSIEVDASKGCPPACVSGSPAASEVTCPSNASMPNDGSSGVIVVGSTVLAEGNVGSDGSPPVTANVLVRTPEALGSTARSTVRSVVKAAGMTLEVFVQLKLEAPGTTLEQSQLSKLCTSVTVNPAGSVPLNVIGLTVPSSGASPLFVSCTR